MPDDRKAPFFPSIDETPSKQGVDEKLYNATQEQRRLEHHARRLEQQRDMLAMVGVQDTDLNSRLADTRHRARELASDIDTTSRL